MGNNFISCNCYEPNGENQMNFRNPSINNINNQNLEQDINPNQIIENLVLDLDLNQINNQGNNIDNNDNHDPNQPNNQENLQNDIFILNENIDNNSNSEYQINENSDSNNNNDSHNNLMNSNNSANSYKIYSNGIEESRQREIVKEEEVFINGLDINNIN